MSESVSEQHSSNHKWIIGVSLASAFAAGIVGFLVYSAVCPCERTPGGFLFGAAADGPVDDWSFANEVPLCQLQIYAGIRPHSINLNCMSTPAGELYLSCSVCEQKYWAARVDANESAVMRLDGVTYPVVLNRVKEPTGWMPPGMRGSPNCKALAEGRTIRHRTRTPDAPPLVDVSRDVPIMSRSVSLKTILKD